MLSNTGGALLSCSIVHTWADVSSATCDAAAGESSPLRSEPSLAVGSAELKGISRPPQLSTLGTSRCAVLQLRMCCSHVIEVWKNPGAMTRIISQCGMSILLSECF